MFISHKSNNVQHITEVEWECRMLSKGISREEYWVWLESVTTDGVPDYSGESGYTIVECNDENVQQRLFQLDEKDKRRYGIKLLECFPKTVAAQVLAAPQATDVQKLAVTFSYRYWKNLTDEADLPQPLRDRIEEVVINSAERQIRAAIPRVLSRL